MYCTPGPDNSNLINTENAVPSNPENKAKIRYNVPISFALLDKNQRSHHRLISANFFSTGRVSILVSRSSVELKSVLSKLGFTAFTSCCANEE